MEKIIFKRQNFYDQSKFNDLKKILSKVNLIQKSKINKNFKIKDISTPENLKFESLLFLNNDYVKKFDKISKILNNSTIHIITDSKDIIDNFKIPSYTYTDNINLCYNKIIDTLYFHPDHELFEDNLKKNNNSFISSSSKIHKSTKIGVNCVIGRGVEIGKNCIIKDNVIIKNSIISDNVIIHENSVIGSTGFGFDPRNLSNSRYEPQIGFVYISKNSSIGTSCTIDRGKIYMTFLGESCMLDNQVHIAHNVILGSNVIIAAQVGIAGSSILGNNVMIGGQAGISGHLKIGNNVMIAAKSGVIKNLKDNSVVAGFPAIDINKWKKMIIKQRNN
ncbi:UDP-3-O-(3-hydroxymyristoyl)glucosamine N-acyltransferase [Alphaproteobacteria bacterium]|nr:UDP-3-O-(3-hydroxymyristoyl)glucosamine N-acyltransferase [Alphaproteobacteria bacterium]